MRAPIVTILFTSLVLSACTMPKLGLPRVHKVTIQQGNVINQEMVDQLKPGMTRNQVRFVLGDPVTRNRFNEDRWDYLYYIDIPGRYHERTYLSLTFEQDRLASFTGNLSPSAAAGPSTPEVPAENIIKDLPPEDDEPADAAAIEAPPASS